VSAWHDVPLHNDDGSLNFICEIPKHTAAKMEVATVRGTAGQIVA
jgi:inorganic pyrophosphatase